MLREVLPELSTIRTGFTV